MFFKIKKLEKENKELKEIVLQNQRPFFGIVENPTKEDLDIIGSNTEITKAIVKYLTHKVVLRMDMLRNTKTKETYEEKVGYLNALNDITLFFYGYLNKKEAKKEEYSGQNLK